MNTQTIAIAAIIVVAIAGVYLAMSPTSPTQQNGNAGTASKQVKVKLTETDDEAKVWVPNTIYLKKGNTYELVVLNGDDDDNHTFYAPGLGVVLENIPPTNGQKTTLLTAGTVGNFTFTDPSVPEWGSTECKSVSGAEEPPCIPPGQIVVQP
ncbi:MAG: cupredoxin domain-containing protein [Thaumarchaeota archaeon]|nr:cupredoxin domain-containing protein [Nitrososphaerota archaeon]MCL5318045.1 cupredoxin domain-containing protein [Nitrososphaerota archaeon]